MPLLEVSRLIGMILPGRDAIVQSTQLSFHRPAYTDMVLEVKGKISRKLDGLKAAQVSISVCQIKENARIDLVTGKVQLGFTEETKK